MHDPAAARWTVGELSAVTGVTVRTLHHYDRISLLVPTARSQAGYRLYAAADLDRLHRILFYRELGFTLEQIAELLDSAGDPAAHLRRQRAVLAARIARLESMAVAIDTELEATRMGIDLTPQERFELFGDGYTDDYAAEAEQRWGETEAYQQSQRRVARYGKDDWAQITAESAAIERRLAGLMAAGEPPNGVAAMDAAEAHRRHIAAWFYDLPVAMHRGLGELYVDDERFAAHYEAIAPGLGAYLAAAIEANAAR
jgi:DNA-binding transcriptional MerR regulator